MADQEQFLDVIDRDEAEARFRVALNPRQLGIESVKLTDSLGRVLAENVVARVDVPSFDRSNVDGYAVRAIDTFGATELLPKSLRLLADSLDAGRESDVELKSGEAILIATGGMIPRGADAIVMVEHAETSNGQLLVRRAVTPGFGVSFAGTDIATGETVLRVGTVMTSRDTGVLAAIGEDRVNVWRRPIVAIVSTGNEIISPGSPLRPAQIYDSNSQVLSDAVREIGGLPQFWGIVRDDVNALRDVVTRALAESDVVLLSGGTSKGKGDLCYRVVAELTDPGIVAHGVALKPGKPLCLAVTQGKPVVILPGFPTSAIFTFHEFVAPVIRLLAGRAELDRETVDAKLAVKVNSEIGRTEYLLVGLAEGQSGYSAFPLGKGSGSVTTFSRADGFVAIPRHTEIVDAGQSVTVHLIGRNLELADLICIGSHCVGLDYLLTELQKKGLTAKLFAVGSSAGLQAIKRGECDVAGVHLLDAETGQYNIPFLSESVQLFQGYGRLQGIVFRPSDERFAEKTIEQIVDSIKQAAGNSTNANSSPLMVNRNQGSGTRILIDRLLGGFQPPGYAVQPTNHNAVAAAVLQGRADWGMTIETVARANQLAFVPYREERYDFVVSKSRLNRPAVQAFLKQLSDQATRRHLADLGFTE